MVLDLALNVDEHLAAKFAQVRGSIGIVVAKLGHSLGNLAKGRVDGQSLDVVLNFEGLRNDSSLDASVGLKETK